MLPVIVKEQCLRHSLSFIVTGSNSVRIYTPPITFRLRMNLRIPIYLTGTRLQDTGMTSLGQPQRVQCSDNAGLPGLDRIILIVNRTGRTGQIINLVALHVDILQDVMSYKLKIRILHQMANIIFLPGKQVVHTYYVVSLFQQFFT